MKLKQDKYCKARGGHSRLLDIKCSKCNQHLFYYQKDGPGILKRAYLDRIYDSKAYENLQHLPINKLPQLVCENCKEHIEVLFVYKKESRLAFRLFEGSVSKQIVNVEKI